MTEHTPGPWAVGEIDADTGQINIVGDGLFIAGVIGGFIDGEATQSANARLIAAAPDLLEMLKVAQLWLDADGRFDMQGINAAIAKAEGRS